MKLPPFKRGDTWNLVFVWKSNNTLIDLTGCTARMQIRKKRSGTLLAEISTDNGIEIAGSEGRVNISFPANITANVEAGTHETDLEITFPSGDVQSSQTLDIPVIEAITK